LNVGQVLETHLGWAAQNLGFRAITPVFDGANDKLIEDALARAWLALKADAIRPDASEGDGSPYGLNLDVPKLEEWLTQQGYVGRDVLDERQMGTAKRACLELWLEEMGSRKVRGLSLEDLTRKAEHLFTTKAVAPPVFGQQTLYDGRTGEPLNQPVTVGFIYMM
jgi:DNA-directed RNA polymerase subunit beta